MNFLSSVAYVQGQLSVFDLQVLLIMTQLLRELAFQSTLLLWVAT